MGMRELVHLKQLNSLINLNLKTATMQKAKSGFSVAGVLSLSPDLFTEVDFEPAQKTKGEVFQIKEQEEEPAGVDLTSTAET